MQNVHTEIKGDKLIITVDVSKKTIDAAEMSKSGKNKLVASTAGVVPVGVNGLKLGLNVMHK